MKSTFALGLLAVGTLLIAPPVLAAEDDVLVVTALPITYSIASTLADGTSIEVRNVPEQGRRLGSLGNLLEQRGDRFEQTFVETTAVVTIGKLWAEDPLFTAARSANVRVVEIDATKPWSRTLEGVTVAEVPREDAPWAEAGARNEAGEPSIYYWLSPSNGVRSAEIVARDLQRLVPAEAERIERNLAGLREQLLGLKREYEARLATLPDVTVAMLAPEFVYLTNELGLFVDTYFFKQDIDWTKQDLARFEAYLRDNDIGVVVHKWEPLQPIMNAITAAGAELVVLDPIDAGLVEDGRLVADGYARLLRRNLEGVHAALAAANVAER